MVKIIVSIQITKPGKEFKIEENETKKEFEIDENEIKDDIVLLDKILDILYEITNKRILQNFRTIFG